MPSKKENQTINCGEKIWIRQREETIFPLFFLYDDLCNYKWLTSRMPRGRKRSCPAAENEAGLKEVDKVFFHHKNLIVPAVVIIAANLLAGAGARDHQDSAAVLLRERAAVLQQAYYGELSFSKAEQKLQKIEVQPLLKEDIETLRNMDYTDFDLVEKVEIRSLRRQSSMFGKVGFHGSLVWYMNGASGRYLQEQDYYILLDTSNGQVRLSRFDPE